MQTLELKIQELVVVAGRCQLGAMLVIWNKFRQENPQKGRVSGEDSVLYCS